MSNYAVICPLEGMEQMAQSQWATTLKKLGHQVATHNLRSINLDPRTDLQRLVGEVIKNKPEAIFVGGGVGFNLPEFYLDPAIQQIPIASFWFDDPLRSVDYWAKEPGYLEALRLPNIYHFVWDGYWRRWLSEHYQVRSFPIHLAADPDQFYPLPAPSEYQDHIVFVGTLVSLKNIETARHKLHPTLHHIATALSTLVESETYGKSTYQILDRIIAGLTPKLLHAYQALTESEPDAILNLRSFAWMLGKNEVRKRILGKALEIAPLLIFCGNWEGTHGSENEIRTILKTNSNRLMILDTRTLDSQNLTSLYAFGKLHLQATDPQSIEGGIPFRVFQTTASQRPLLTDRKLELAECYCYEKELLTFESEHDFPDALQKALNGSEALKEIAQQGYQRFLKEHTWKHRFEYVMKKIKDNL